MDVVRTIRPGDPGSHRFLDEWGDTLYTTIEVIVDERQASTATQQ